MKIALPDGACQEEQAEAKRIYDMYGAGRVKILQLYANPREWSSRGETAQLCYGVSNPKPSPSIGSPRRCVALIARCVDVAPTKETTYVVTAQDANGHTETANVTIRCGNSKPGMGSRRPQLLPALLTQRNQAARF